jgi:ribose transport system ATP-binding protein
MSGIRKSYGPTAALSGVDLELLPGEVHALIGENGAGKSTLMKVLSGAEQPDAGDMQLDGSPYSPTGPHAARSRGVVMIYQELAICPDLSVEANVMLGCERAKAGFLEGARNRAAVATALSDLGHPEIDPTASAATLAPAELQVVEIARALVGSLQLLVLDEPTSALGSGDAERLFALIRRLKEKGVTVVYISHFLEEIEQIADRFTVLRDGRAVGSGHVGDVPRERIIEMMVGRTVTEHYPRVPHSIGSPILELRDLCGAVLPAGATLTLRRGEILGVAGIVGSGRTEMLRAVYGLDPVRSGTVTVAAYSGNHCTPAGRIKQGVGLVSEDRKSEGLALRLSIADNLTLSRLESRAGVISLTGLRRAVLDLLVKFGVKCRDASQSVGELSGGNQQKVAIARLFHQRADIFVLDEPTKGVDVGSKADIYRTIGEAAASGQAVLVVSSYLPELFGVCDTLTVMCRGKLTPALPISEWTPQAAIAAATGANLSPTPLP